MIDKETYKREIVRMWDSIRDDKYKGYYDYDSAICECSGVRCCEECALYGVDCGSSTNAFEMIEAVEKWSKEHPQKKHKVSRAEYDILRTAIDFCSEDDTFDDYDLLHGLLENGYFNGAGGRMFIRYYFNNCEVVEDD